jgi:hypothetical protein
VFDGFDAVSKTVFEKLRGEASAFIDGTPSTTTLG